MKTLLLGLSLCAILTAAETPILLWPAGAPGSEGKTEEEVVTTSASGEQTVSNIHKPSIMPYLPASETVQAVD